MGMKDGEFLTVKEFANSAARTTQAIYQQIDNKLKPYCQCIDGKKMIEKRALKEVFNIDPDQELDKKKDSKNITIDSNLYKILKEELEAKNKQILSLQEQVLSLQAELFAEHQHSREQADKIAIFADQAQKLQLAQMKPQLSEDEDLEMMRERKGIFRRMLEKLGS